MIAQEVISCQKIWINELLIARKRLWVRKRKLEKERDSEL